MWNLGGLSLPRKSMSRLIAQPDMTLTVLTKPKASSQKILVSCASAEHLF